MKFLQKSASERLTQNDSVSRIYFAPSSAPTYVNVDYDEYWASQEAAAAEPEVQATLYESHVRQNTLAANADGSYEESPYAVQEQAMKHYQPRQSNLAPYTDAGLQNIQPYYGPAPVAAAPVATQVYQAPQQVVAAPAVNYGDLQIDAQPYYGPAPVATQVYQAPQQVVAAPAVNYGDLQIDAQPYYGPAPVAAAPVATQVYQAPQQVVAAPAVNYGDLQIDAQPYYGPAPVATQVYQAPQQVVAAPAVNYGDLQIDAQPYYGAAPVAAAPVATQVYQAPQQVATQTYYAPQQVAQTTAPVSNYGGLQNIQPYHGPAPVAAAPVPQAPQLSQAVGVGRIEAAFAQDPITASLLGAGAPVSTMAAPQQFASATSVAHAAPQAVVQTTAPETAEIPYNQVSVPCHDLDQISTLVNHRIDVPAVFAKEGVSHVIINPSGTPQGYRGKDYVKRRVIIGGVKYKALVYATPDRAQIAKGNPFDNRLVWTHGENFGDDEAGVSIHTKCGKCYDMVIPRIWNDNVTRPDGGNGNGTPGDVNGGKDIGSEPGGEGPSV